MLFGKLLLSFLYHPTIFAGRAESYYKQCFLPDESRESMMFLIHCKVVGHVDINYAGAITDQLVS